MARLRNAPTSQQPATKAAAQRPALKEKTNTTRAKVPVYENDGDTEGLVKNARSGRRREKATAGAEEELVMTGGLGHAGSDDRILERSGRLPTTDELAKSDQPPLPAAKINRRLPPRMARKAVQSKADSDVVDGVKRRMPATARTRATAVQKQPAPAPAGQSKLSSDSFPSKTSQPRKSSNSMVERSEFSISPSPPPSGKLNSVSKQRLSVSQPGSALRSHTTPLVESSILALKNFRRRPRQPSMLQMVQQRTASARPSAAHIRTAQDESVYDIDPFDDDVEDFEPEAEGTPMHVTRKIQQATAMSKIASKRQSGASPVTSTKSRRKRKSDDADLSASALDTTNTKRRRTTTADADEQPITGPRKSSSVQQTFLVRQASSTPRLAEDVEVVNSSPSSTPPTEPSSPVQQQAELDEDVVIPSTEKEQDGVQRVPLSTLR